LPYFFVCSHQPAVRTAKRLAPTWKRGTAEGRVAGETGSTTAWLRIALQYRLLNHLAFSNRHASLRTPTPDYAENPLFMG